MRQNEICPRGRCIWARFDGSRTICTMPACREPYRRAVAKEAIQQERVAAELARAERRKWELEHKREVLQWQRC